MVAAPGDAPAPMADTACLSFSAAAASSPACRHGRALCLRQIVRQMTAAEDLCHFFGKPADNESAYDVARVTDSLE